MGHEQDRLARPGAAQPRHQVALARCRFEHPHIVARKTGCTQPCRHGIGRTPRITGRRDRVDFDKLLENVEGELLLRCERLRRRGTCKAQCEQHRRRNRPGRHECETSIHDAAPPHGQVLPLTQKSPAVSMAAHNRTLHQFHMRSKEGVDGRHRPTWTGRLLPCASVWSGPHSIARARQGRTVRLRRHSAGPHRVRLLGYTGGVRGRPAARRVRLWPMLSKTSKN
jgi:hypothetical protein